MLSLLRMIPSELRSNRVISINNSWTSDYRYHETEMRRSKYGRSTVAPRSVGELSVADNTIFTICKYNSRYYYPSTVRLVLKRKYKIFTLLLECHGHCHFRSISGSKSTVSTFIVVIATNARRSRYCTAGFSRQDGNTLTDVD